MTDVKLYLGDCLEVMRGMPDKCVDAVITDPPYFLPAQHYQTRKQFQRNFSDLGILEHFFKDLYTEMARVIRDDGCFYMFCDGQSYPLFWYHGFKISKSVRPLIWDKSVSINGYGWRHQHEIILFGEMPKAKVSKPDLKLIHVKLPEAVHRALRVKVAELDTSIQDWVSKLVTENLSPNRK